MSQPDEAQLAKLLDHARVEVFRNSNAAFLASVLCSLDFKWETDDSVTTTAAVDSKTMYWHKDDFLRCDQNERKCTILHETWHPARLHFVRGMGKDSDTWNKACDIRINNDMIEDGYKLPDNGYWLFDPSIDADGKLSEEEIYVKLMKQEIKLPPHKGRRDMVSRPMDQNQQNQMVAQQMTMVIRAVQAAKSAGKPGCVPGGVEEALDKFLNPVVPWRSVLLQWMTDRTAEDYSWLKRNRRFTHIYMPSLETIPDGLEHLAFFIDTSGSISDPAVERFNSEVKYIWETLKPRQLTLIQFDTRIHDVRVFKEGDEFVDIKVYGRGGTSMVCVREWIEENSPTAVVVFSDMQCTPMVRPSRDVPVLWAVVPGGCAELPDYGRVIHVTE